MKNLWISYIITMISLLLFVSCVANSPKKYNKELTEKKNVYYQRNKTKLPTFFDSIYIKGTQATHDEVIYIGGYPFYIDRDSIHKKKEIVRLKYKYILRLNAGVKNKVAKKEPEKGAQECLPKILYFLEKEIGQADSYTYCRLKNYDNLRVGAQWHYKNGNICLYINPSDVAKQDSLGDMIYTSDIVISISQPSR